jgi:hypothetical protein
VAYLESRLRGKYKEFFNKFWSELVLDGDERGELDFGGRYEALVHSILPNWSLPTSTETGATDVAEEGPTLEADFATEVAEEAAAAVEARFAAAELERQANAAAAREAAARAAAEAEAAARDGTPLSEETKKALAAYFKLLWRLRFKWAGVYVRKHLLLTMLTTGRSESWHGVMKGSVGFTSNLTLTNFVVFHDRVLQAQDEKAVSGRRNAAHKDPDALQLYNSHPVVVAAKKLFSPYAASLVNAALIASHSYVAIADSTNAEENGTTVCYKVMRPENFSAEDEEATSAERCRQDRIVRVQVVDGAAVGAHCSCRMVESRGLPCRHMLAVFNFRQRFTELHPFMYNQKWAKLGRSAEELTREHLGRPPPLPLVPLPVARTATGGDAARSR